MDIASLKLKIDSTDAKNAQSDLEKLSTSGEKTEKTFASMAVQIAGASAVLGTVIAVAKSSVEAANEYQNSLKGLASVARYAGEDIGSTLSTAAKLSEDGILSTTEAVTALKNLLAKGFSTDEAVTMIGRFKDAAAFGRQSSLEFGQAVVSATEGIKNENSMLVDNAGVTKNVAKMVEDYAKSIDKSTNALSEAEKRQAIYNGLLQETEAQVGNAALAAQGLTGQQAILSKAIKDTSITIGTELMPAATAIVKLLGDGFNGINENAIKPFLFLFNNVGITIGEVAMKAGAFYEFMTSPMALLKDPQASLKKFQAEIRGFGDAAEQAREEAASRISGVVTVDIGADSGARRNETVVTPKALKEKKDQLTAEHEYMISVGRTTEELIKKAQAMELENELIGKTASEIMQITNARYDEKIAIKESEAAQLQGIKGKEAEVFLIKEQIKAMEQLKSAGTARESLSKIADENKKAAEKSERAWQNFSDNVQNVFSSSLYNGMMGTFGGIEEMFKQMILRMIAEAAAAQMMISMKSGFSGLGGLFGSSTGGGENYGSSGISESNWISGAKADGGPVSGGSSYLVGERGPEIFTPSSTGNITPNNKIGGGGITINDNTVINIDSRSDRMQVMKDVQKMIENGHAKLIDNLQRQGQLA